MSLAFVKVSHITFYQNRLTGSGIRRVTMIVLCAFFALITRFRIPAGIPHIHSVKTLNALTLSLLYFQTFDHSPLTYSQVQRENEQALFLWLAVATEETPFSTSILGDGHEKITGGVTVSYRT